VLVTYDSQELAPPRILLVDDELVLIKSLTVALEGQGYRVDTALDGPTALVRSAAAWPDLVLLDLMLPGLDGMEVCRRLRAVGPVLIIMLTARSEVNDKVMGLDLGADDYITKPFVLRELLARVRAALRRGGERGAALASPGASGLQTPWAVDDLVVDSVRQTVFRAGREIELSPKEFRLLTVLAAYSGLDLTREQLITEVWKNEFMGDESTLNVHIRWLREKIEPNPSQPTLILTVRGVGYRFAGARRDVDEH
jgi:DNA-binding response OmpR family regulator